MSTTTETWQLIHEKGTVALMWGVSPNGEAEAGCDGLVPIAKGVTLLGKTYDEWMALPDGPITVTCEDGFPVSAEPSNIEE